MINLQIFAETYFILEDKALEIMGIYGIGHYDLDGIEIEQNNNKLELNIKTSLYFSGCGTESEWLTFDLDEMNNDIEYFKNKRQSELEKKELEKKLVLEKAAKKLKLQKEEKDKVEYERLKKKFES